MLSKGATEAMYNLNLTSDELPQTWSFSISYNDCLDFVVWVLEADGLQVPPFDQHPEGSQCLQASGLTAQAWQTWLTNTVQHLHYGDLLLQHEQRAPLRQAWQAQVKQAAVTLAQQQQLDPTVVEARLERHFARQAAIQQTALAAARQIYGETTPPDVRRDKPPSVWVGAPAVADPLRELWSDFRALTQPRARSWDWLMNVESEDYEPERPPTGEQRTDLWTRLHPYQAHLKGFKIELIAYPAAVTYLVPPFSLLLSAPPACRTRQRFEERVVQAVAQLAQLNQQREP